MKVLEVDGQTDGQPRLNSMLDVQKDLQSKVALMFHLSCKQEE